MQKILLNGKAFEQLIDGQTIAERITLLARQIDEDYQGKKPLFIVVLNGAFMFASDLIKQIQIDCEVSFVRLSSYSQMKSTGTVTQLLGLQEKLENRHVIVVEDIIDSGNTIHAIMQEMLPQNPQSLEIATFLIKPEALQHKIKPRYSGFDIANDFVVGYGLDFDGLGRNTPHLYVLAS
ncbi:MAG: hypoxanthine phosphoribosyltransferase [Verrucomicrobia bacterium]|nr:hypoxanthine phosphoribosyltransferase [Cytophagales bacterium]